MGYVLRAVGTMEGRGQGNGIGCVLQGDLWEENGWGWRGPDWKQEAM